MATYQLTATINLVSPGPISEEDLLEWVDALQDSINEVAYIAGISKPERIV